MTASAVPCYTDDPAAPPCETGCGLRGGNWTGGADCARHRHGPQCSPATCRTYLPGAGGALVVAAAHPVADPTAPASDDEGSWQATGHRLLALAERVPWALGRWWAEGEDAGYGARTAFARSKGANPDTLRRYATVWRAVVRAGQAAAVLPPYDDESNNQDSNPGLGLTTALVLAHSCPEMLPQAVEERWTQKRARFEARKAAEAAASPAPNPTDGLTADERWAAGMATIDRGIGELIHAGRLGGKGWKADRAEDLWDLAERLNELGARWAPQP